MMLLLLGIQNFWPRVHRKTTSMRPAADVETKTDVPDIALRTLCSATIICMGTLLIVAINSARSRAVLRLIFDELFKLHFWSSVRMTWVLERSGKEHASFRPDRMVLYTCQYRLSSIIPVLPAFHNDECHPSARLTHTEMEYDCFIHD